MSLSPAFTAPPKRRPLPAGDARPFRARHDPDGAATCSSLAAGIFTQLGQEWPRLTALPSTAATLARWGRAQPALLDVTSLGALLDLIDDSDQARKDELLLALLRLAQGGQQLAGRVVLQAMLPKLARMVRSTRPLSSDDFQLEDRRHTAVAVFWEVMFLYPVDRRPSSVAGNLALDTLRQLTGMRKAPVETPAGPPTPADQRLDGAYEETQISSPGLTSDANLLEVLAWALDNGAVSRSDAALLARVYLPGLDELGYGAAVAAAAQELGKTQVNVRKMCSRARSALKEAVQADAAAPLLTRQTEARNVALT